MDLLIITNSKLCKNGGLLNRIEEIFTMYRKGKYLVEFQKISIVLREKDLAPYQYEELLSRVLLLCQDYKIELIAHKYYNAAKKLGVSKIHLPVKDIQKAHRENNNFTKEFSTIGVSTHSIEEAVLARSLGATYITYSHIFPTKCKEDLEPKGIENLNTIKEKIDLPIYALGGINDRNIKSINEVGIKGVAIMSGIMRGDYRRSELSSLY